MRDKGNGLAIRSHCYHQAALEEQGPFLLELREWGVWLGKLGIHDPIELFVETGPRRRSVERQGSM